MAKWTESDLFKKVSGKSGLTRFVGWFNNLLNPGHDWMDYSAAPESGQGLFNSVKNQVTQEHMTGADIEANELSMQNMEDQYQRQVTGMQKAGLNPALMYQNGASGSTPQAQNTGNGLSMSELMQVMLLPLQKKMMEAQTSHIDAQAERERAETVYTKQRTVLQAMVNEYYPDVTQAQMDETLSRIGVNVSTVDEKEANAALAWSKKFLTDAEGKYADEFFAARNRLTNAQSDAAAAAAVRDAAQAAFTAYETQYAKDHKARLSSSNVVALVGLLSSALESAAGKVGAALDGFDLGEQIGDALKGLLGNEEESSGGSPGVPMRDHFKRWRKSAGHWLGVAWKGNMRWD